MYTCTCTIICKTRLNYIYNNIKSIVHVSRSDSTSLVYIYSTCTCGINEYTCTCTCTFEIHVHVCVGEVCACSDLC